MSASTPASSGISRLPRWLAGLLVSVLIWGLIASVSAVADEALYRLDDACFQRSVHDFTRIGTTPHGCVPGFVFAVLAATRYGPGLFIPLRSDVAQRWAPLVSGLFFAATGAVSFQVLRGKSGIIAAVVAILLVLCAEGFFFLLLAGAEGLLL